MPSALSEHRWPFPLSRTHTGIPLGNGRMGVLAWGEKNRLRLTLGRADFWDRRGFKTWTPAMSYARIRKFLEAGDEAAIRALFSDEPKEPGFPNRSSVLPVGRVDLLFPEGISLEEGILDFASGTVTVRLREAASGRPLEAAITLSLRTPTLDLSLPEGLPVEVVGVPAWEYVGDYLRSISFPEPEPIETGPIRGWRQATPRDEALSVGWKRRPGGLRIAAALGEGETLEAALDASDEAGDRAWRKAYWETVPTIDVPDERYRLIYALGLHKFAGLTHPAGVAANLQGPWVEEYRMPPWSNDYHFNINVQMCYGPAYATGLTAHLAPLFRLIESWMPRLRENARLFAGIEDGYLLPHATDDRGGIIGAFWTGTIDHACTAWIGRMMFDHWLYSGDLEFLRRTAYPFMAGALRVYEAMMERRPDGSLSLPVTVSPEYRGDAMNAWGRDASFQLAACHSLAEALERAADALGEAPLPAWREIREKLPLATLVPDSLPHLALWEGVPLEESHRHHSHLAGISPFDTIDVADARWRPIVEASIRHWYRMGMGRWTGWCVPWAAMLHHRTGSPELAVALMRYWEAFFTNEGHGTLHDPLFADSPFHPTGSPRGRPPEIMQMDAAMSATTAILDGLLHARRGVHYLFQGAPAAWRTCGFGRIRGEGGFEVSARRGPDGVERVGVTATRDGEFRLGNPWPGDGRGPVLSLRLKAGETHEFLP